MLRQICLVGSRKFSAFGSHGAIDHIQLRHFSTLTQCCCFLHEERGMCCKQSFLFAAPASSERAGLNLAACSAGCRVVGVELGRSAQPVHMHPFCGPTAFMLGNEVRCRAAGAHATQECNTRPSWSLPDRAPGCRPTNWRPATRWCTSRSTAPAPPA